jgi:hypothetical protein
MVAEGGYVLAGYRIGRSRQGVANRLTLLRARYRCDTTLQLVWLHRDAIEAHTAPRSLWTAS